jgi:hypothetical protein
MQRNAAITDVLTGAAVVSAGITLYLAISSSGSKDPAAAAAPPSKPRIGFTPTWGGLAAVGSF